MTSPSPMRPREKEADDEQKPFDKYLSHLVILHFDSGYDHWNHDDAEAMEGLEQDKFAYLGIPYLTPGGPGADGLKMGTRPTHDTLCDMPLNLPAVVQVRRGAASGCHQQKGAGQSAHCSAGSRDRSAPIKRSCSIRPPGRARAFPPSSAPCCATFLGLHERRIADATCTAPTTPRSACNAVPVGELMSLFESAADSRLVLYNETPTTPRGIVQIPATCWRSRP